MGARCFQARIFAYTPVSTVVGEAELVCKRWRRVVLEHGYCVSRLQLSGIDSNWAEVEDRERHLLDLCIDFTIYWAKRGWDRSVNALAADLLLKLRLAAGNLRHLGLNNFPLGPNFLRKLALALPELRSMSIAIKWALSSSIYSGIPTHQHSLAARLRKY